MNKQTFTLKYGARRDITNIKVACINQEIDAIGLPNFRLKNHKKLEYMIKRPFIRHNIERIKYLDNKKEDRTTLCVEYKNQSFTILGAILCTIISMPILICTEIFASIFNLFKSIKEYVSVDLINSYKTNKEIEIIEEVIE